MKFRKKPVVVEATQWRWLGDHPQVVDYRWVDGDRVCVKCALMMKRHGWIRTLDGGDIVHPGDWIVPDEDGEGFFRAIEEPFFEMEYESVEPWVEGFEAENAVCKREWIEDAVVKRDRVGEILFWWMGR